MKTTALIALSVALFATAGIATSASAQEKTRADVRQELIQAETQGLHFVTDTSYPEVNPIFEQQVARLQLQGGGTGAPMGGSSAAGKQAIIAVARTAAPSSCVGPSGFCTLYFGS
ncbi:DUF4148 domain-containing protein [Paraburkholderia elongata]|uniref:DUF4148 domain-containing protein n=1 Tax=Paraburkholderia elongata TaxID=2675747 RepID=A0A972NKV3_9BURK|nr:DUF4148 domain-containing protein [Paraburkholderia elongata]NPT55376.1 DUF4148 domain-containing protein [Paraburkholderia elongata]